MKEIVSVADMKVSKQQDTVIVTHGLGSCLGVSMYDPASKLGGLLHVMMPVSNVNPQKAEKNPCTFVDTAIPAFLDKLEAIGAKKESLVVKVAGGAKTNGLGNDRFEIGKKNYITLRKVFWKHGLLIDGEDVGGVIARTMYLDIDSGRVWLSSAGKEWDI